MYHYIILRRYEKTMLLYSNYFSQPTQETHEKNLGSALALRESCVPPPHVASLIRVEPRIEKDPLHASGGRALELAIYPSLISFSGFLTRVV